MNNVITVSQLNTYIKNIINAEELLRYIVACGEVFSISIVSGNAFITLADKDAQISCVCFDVSKTYIPKKGDKILITGGLSYYVKSGKMTFIGHKIELAGQGSLLQKFDELKKKLQAEGLFDEKRKRKIKPYAKKIAVVTSLTGAVIRDIVRTVRLKNPVIDINIIDTRVQGDTAYADIIRGLDIADELKVDTVILARGGGALEDLLPFFDERVVRRVASMQTPTISAVGHETDFSLTDFAADLRAATPTAAAEAAAYNYYELIENIASFLAKIDNDCKRVFEGKQQKYRLFAESIVHKSKNFIDKNVAQVRNIAAQSYFNISNKLTLNTHILDKLTDKLNADNPINLIKKGLFKIERDGKAATTVKDIKVGDSISIFSYEGKLYAKVEKVELKKEQ